jgi:hypothetical protein
MEWVLDLTLVGRPIFHGRARPLFTRSSEANIPAPGYFLTFAMSQIAGLAHHWIRF